MTKSIFITTFFEQRRTIHSLLEESQANNSFYVFLSAASFIISLGFLANSLLIIVGGMLAAPLLFPVLSLGMGIATSSGSAIQRAFLVILKSIIITLIISFVTAFIFHDGGINEQMSVWSEPSLLFFLTAFTSGIIAAFAWIKENIKTTLPGIAVTVTLLPPLALVGVSFSIFSREVFTGSIEIFLINLLGIVLGSTLIFSLFGFSKLQDVEEKRIKEEKLERKVQQAARQEATEAEQQGDMTPLP